MKTFYEPIRKTSPFKEFENTNLTIVQQMAKEERQRQYEHLEEQADAYLVDMLLQQMGSVKQNVFHGGFVSGKHVQIEEQPEAEKRQQCKWVLRELKGIAQEEMGEYFSQRDKNQDNATKFKYGAAYNELRRIKALANEFEPLEVIEQIKEIQLQQQ